MDNFFCPSSILFKMTSNHYPFLPISFLFIICFIIFLLFICMFFNVQSFHLSCSPGLYISWPPALCLFPGPGPIPWSRSQPWPWPSICIYQPKPKFAIFAIFHLGLLRISLQHRYIVQTSVRSFSSFFPLLLSIL